MVYFEKFVFFIEFYRLLLVVVVFVKISCYMVEFDQFVFFQVLSECNVVKIIKSVNGCMEVIVIFFFNK